MFACPPDPSAGLVAFFQATLHDGFKGLDPATVDQLSAGHLPDVTPALQFLGPHWLHLLPATRDFLIKLLLDEVPGRSVSDLVSEMGSLIALPSTVLRCLVDTMELRGTQVPAADLAVIFELMPEAMTPRYLDAMIPLCSTTGHNRSLLQFLAAIGPMQLKPLTQRFLLSLLGHVEVTASTARQCWHQHIAPQASTDPRAVAMFLNHLANRARSAASEAADQGLATVTCSRLVWQDPSGSWLPYPLHISAYVLAQLDAGAASCDAHVWTAFGALRQVSFDLSRGVDGITSKAAAGAFANQPPRPVRVDPPIDLLAGLDWQNIRGLDWMHIDSHSSLANEALIFEAIKALLPKRLVHFADLLIDPAKAAVFLETMRDYRRRGYVVEVVPATHGPSAGARIAGMDTRMDVVEKILHTGLRHAGASKNAVHSANGSVYGPWVYLDLFGGDQGFPYGGDTGCSFSGLLLLVRDPKVDSDFARCDRQDARFREDLDVFLANEGRWAILRNPELFLLTSVICHTAPGALAPYPAHIIRDLFRDSSHDLTLPIDRHGNEADYAGTALTDLPVGPILVPRPSTNLWQPPSQVGFNLIGVRRSMWMNWGPDNIAAPVSAKKRPLEADQPADPEDAQQDDQPTPLESPLQWIERQRKRYKLWQGSVLRACKRGDSQHARFIQEQRPAGVHGMFSFDRADEHYDSKFPPLLALQVNVSDSDDDDVVVIPAPAAILMPIPASDSDDDMAQPASAQPVASDSDDDMAQPASAQPVASDSDSQPPACSLDSDSDSDY